MKLGNYVANIMKLGKNFNQILKIFVSLSHVPEITQPFFTILVFKRK